MNGQELFWSWGKFEEKPGKKVNYNLRLYCLFYTDKVN